MIEHNLKEIIYVISEIEKEKCFKLFSHLERKEIGTALGFPTILSFYIRRGVNNYIHG
jgi:hypothetical protein